jgi:hypothetical protein
MENQVINVTEETLAFKLLCNVLESDPQTVATVLNTAHGDVTAAIIDGILLGEEEAVLDNAVHLYKAELLSQSK